MPKSKTLPRTKLRVSECSLVGAGHPSWDVERGPGGPLAISTLNVGRSSQLVRRRVQECILREYNAKLMRCYYAGSLKRPDHKQEDHEHHGESCQ
jgi:hypothetical protein